MNTHTTDTRTRAWLCALVVIAALPLSSAVLWLSAGLFLIAPIGPAWLAAALVLGRIWALFSPLAEPVAKALLRHSGTGLLLGTLSEWPVLGWAGLSHSSTLAGLLIAPLAGVLWPLFRRLPTYTYFPVRLNSASFSRTKKWRAGAAVAVVAIVAGLHPFILRKSFERAASRELGSDVHIERMSRRDGAWVATNIRAGDPRLPSRHWFELDEARAVVDMSALLRGRIWIDELAIEGVRIWTDRDTASAPEALVATAPPPAVGEWLLPARGTVVETYFTQLARMTARGDLTGELSGDSRAKVRSEILEQVNELREKWVARERALPSSVDIRDARASGTDGGDRLKRYRGLLSDEIEARRREISRVKERVAGLADKAKEEADRVWAQAGFPGHPAGDLTPALLGPKALNAAERAMSFLLRAAPWPPTPSRAGSAIVGYRRSRDGRGISIEAGEPGSRPRLHLAKLTLRSRVTDPHGLVATSTLADLSSFPERLGRPMSASGEGEAEGLKLGAMRLKASGPLAETDPLKLDLSMEAIPVTDYELRETPELGLRVVNARISADMRAEISREGCDIALELKSSPQSLIARSKLREIETAFACAGEKASVPPTATGRLHGKWNALALELKSPYGTTLGDCFDRQAELHVLPAREALRQHAADESQKLRDELEALLRQLEHGHLDPLRDRLASFGASRRAGL